MMNEDRDKNSKGIKEDKNKSLEKKSIPSKLEESKYKLYSPNMPEYKDERVDLTQKETNDTEHDWQSFDSSPQAKPKKDSLLTKLFKYFSGTENAFLHRLLFGSIIFFVVALGVAGAVFLGGLNTISSDNVLLVVSGPVSVASGTDLPLSITIRNTNSTNLENVKLTITYPAGTQSQDGGILARDEENLSTIASGDQLRRVFHSVYYGKKGEIKKINVHINYDVADSNGTFSKTKDYSVSLDTAPASLTIERPSQVQTNQEFQFIATINSNAPNELHNVLLTATLPQGFTLTGSDPVLESGKPVWKIDNLKPQDKKIITIVGYMEGLTNDARTIDFTLGSSESTSSEVVSTVFATNKETLRITQAPLEVRLAVNGVSDKSAVVSLGTTQKVLLTYKNNTDHIISDIKLSVVLSGVLAQEETVRPTNSGFYNSSNNTVTWDKVGDFDLSSLDAGEQGSVGFDFKTEDLTDELSTLQRNPVIGINAKAVGNRPVADVKTEQVSSATTQQLRVTTMPFFGGELLYESGPYTNTGPIPPIAEELTTYGVKWSLKNNFNNIDNAVITAVLPPYVEWLGGASNGVTYNSSFRTVTWAPGIVLAGTGYTTSSSEAYFQISFLPSVTQVGELPPLVQAIHLTGVDEWTKQKFSQNFSDISTGNVEGSTQHSQKRGIVVR